MDAITLLRKDHATVEKHFKTFEKAGDKAFAAKRRAVDAIVRELSVHAAIEEQVFYPTVRAAVEKANGLVLESLEEHHVVKWMLSEIEKMSPEEERFGAKVTVLIENVRHHVKEEEQDLFPQVRKALSRGQLDDLGEQLAQAKKLAPTHPHPRQPDSPPGNIVAGVIGATADVARDLIRGATGKPVASIGATGTAKRTARSVADRTSARTTRVAKTAQKRTTTAAASARGAAKGAAKGATTGARRGAAGGRSSARAAATRSTSNTGTSRPATKRTAAKATSTRSTSRSAAGSRSRRAS